MSRRALVGWWVTAVVATGLATVALALVLGGGAPLPAPPGLTDNGRLPAWLGSLTAFVVLVVGVVSVGLGLLGSGWLDRERRPMRSAAGAAASWWAALTVFQIGLLSWELRGRADLVDSVRFKALAVQLVLVVVAAACWWLGRQRPVFLAALAASLGALLPVVLIGHPRSSDHPVIVGISVSAHVIGAALWVGGLSAIGWMAASGDRRWGAALPRYSQLAFGSVVVLMLSGLLTTVTRLTTPSELLTSHYGAIVSLKIVLLAGLVAAGWMQRQYVFRRTPFLRRHFLAIAALELTTMTIALALAVALARTPPPV